MCTDPSPAVPAAAGVLYDVEPAVEIDLEPATRSS
jgi:hypothetical protein